MCYENVLRKCVTHDFYDFEHFRENNNDFCDFGLKNTRFVRFFGWQPQFCQNVRKPFCRHRAFQSELGADFLRIGKLRPRSFRCMSSHPAIRNIASQNLQKLSHTRKHPIGNRFPKNARSTTF